MKRTPISESQARSNHWVNFYRTQEERREQYNTARAFGLLSVTARKLRDYRPCTFKKKILAMTGKVI